ncbi:hypothetical protein Dimus_026330 [Dionaea muscipula]
MAAVRTNLYPRHCESVLISSVAPTSPRHGAASARWWCYSNPRRPSPPLSLGPSSSTTSTVLSRIQDAGVIACLRAPSAELAIGCARAALDAGITVLETVVSAPGALEVLAQLVREYPESSIGVGTVVRPVDARAAIDAGAKFLMGPVFLKDVLDVVQARARVDSEVVYIPGAMTATEVLSAHTAGARLVKVYPVSAVGGANYISALRKPFPGIPLVASQGITTDLVGEYIAAGATAVVLSDAIFDRGAVERGDFGAVSQQARLIASLGYEAVRRKNININDHQLKLFLPSISFCKDR